MPAQIMMLRRVESCDRRPSHKTIPPTPAIAKPVASWLVENVDVSGVATAVETVVVWLDFAATAVPMAKAPAPITIFVRLRVLSSRSCAPARTGIEQLNTVSNATMIRIDFLLPRVTQKDTILRQPRRFEAVSCETHWMATPRLG